jgi:uroporphyrinogen-III decarboxylase
MTNRERCIRTLLCEKTDRAPFPMWLGFAPWGETYERWKTESGIADLDLTRHFGFERFFHCVPAELGPFPHFTHTVIKETDEFVIATDWRGITTRNRRDGHSIPEFLSHPIKTPADWQRYKEDHLQQRAVDRLPGLKSFAADMAGIDAPVQVGCFPWGVFGTARDLMGAEELLMAFYDEPDLVRDIMRTCTDVWLAVYEEVVKSVRVDHIHIWEDMSGKQGSLISMAMIEEFMMPQYDRLTAFASRHGIPIISVDSDGLVDELVPAMMRHGMNAFLPFEVQAGNSVEEYRRLYPKLGIMGGLDKNALAKGKPELHRELDRAEKMLALGGYVPGFDHLIPPDATWSNFTYFVEHLRKMILG